MLRPRHLFLVLPLFAGALVAAESTRFSQSLNNDQRAATGIARLDSNQVAALDALVRLNLNQANAAALKAERAATADSAPAATATEPAAFSQSLSVDQRRAAGLDQLTAAETAAVDHLVANQVAATPRYSPGETRPVEAVQFFPNRLEVHGEVGFSFGAGSGGYSSRAAWMTTSLLDTKTGTEFAVTVATGREKWKRPYRWTNDWEDVSFSLETPLFGKP